MQIVEPHAFMLTDNSWGLEATGVPGKFTPADGDGKLKNVELYEDVTPGERQVQAMGRPR